MIHYMTDVMKKRPVLQTVFKYFWSAADVVRHFSHEKLFFVVDKWRVHNPFLHRYN